MDGECEDGERGVSWSAGCVEGRRLEGKLVEMMRWVVGWGDGRLQVWLHVRGRMLLRLLGGRVRHGLGGKVGSRHTLSENAWR